MDGIGFFLLLVLIVGAVYGAYYWANIVTKKASESKISR